MQKNSILDICVCLEKKIKHPDFDVYTATWPSDYSEMSQKNLVDFFYPPEQRIRFSLDINNAPPRELSLLPGIGPAMALRIIETRQQRGPFKSIDDIIHVRGIGKITLEDIRPFIHPITKH